MRAKTYTVKFRRKGEGKTNYRKRLKLLQGGKPRLAVRGSLKNILAQIIEYHPDGDRVLVSASSKELEKFGWKATNSTIPAGYLTGYLLGQKGAKKKIGQLVLDLGLGETIKGGRVYAVLKGCLDAGLEINYDKEVLPSDERIKGEHIAKYASLLKKQDIKSYERRFSDYIKKGIDPEQLPAIFIQTKNKIEGGKYAEKKETD